MKKFIFLFISVLLSFGILFFYLNVEEDSADLYNTYDEALNTYLQNNYNAFEILETIDIDESKVVFIYGNNEFFSALEIEKIKDKYKPKKILESFDLVSNPYNLIDGNIFVKDKTIHFIVGKLNDTSLDYDPFVNVPSIRDYKDNIIFSYQIIE